MKKAIFGLFVVMISVGAHAEMTCIGQLGKMDTRVIVQGDGIDQVEIKRAGDSAYIGKFKEDRLGVLFGVAVADHGAQLKFSFETRFNQTTKKVTLEMGTENEQGVVHGGTLNCVVLD